MGLGGLEQYKRFSHRWLTLGLHESHIRKSIKPHIIYLADFPTAKVGQLANDYSTCLNVNSLSKEGRSRLMDPPWSKYIGDLSRYIGCREMNFNL